MIKETTVDEKVYEIDTTPSYGKRRYLYATIYEVRETRAIGRLANLLCSEGKDPVTRILVYIEDAETVKVTLALGYNFSRSKAWRNLYTWAAMRQRREQAS